MNFHTPKLSLMLRALSPKSCLLDTSTWMSHSKAQIQCFQNRTQLLNVLLFSNFLSSLSDSSSSFPDSVSSSSFIHMSDLQDFALDPLLFLISILSLASPILFLWHYCLPTHANGSFLFVSRLDVSAELPDSYPAACCIPHPGYSGSSQTINIQDLISQLALPLISPIMQSPTTKMLINFQYFLPYPSPQILPILSNLLFLPPSL